jgi:hypothetical protein
MRCPASIPCEVRLPQVNFAGVAIQFRAEPGTIPHEALWTAALTSADSGLQLDLEIALSGVSAKIQPLRLIQPCRRCVETSGDVIEGTFYLHSRQPYMGL